MKRIVDWINQAWMEIQEHREEWEFQRTEDVTLVTTQNNQEVGLPADVGAPIALTLTDGATRHPVAFRQRSAFEATYRLATFTQQRPTLWTVVGNNIRFNTLADAAYPLRLEYFKRPSEMVNNTDLPGVLPVEYHGIIIYQAMMFYGEYDDAPEVFNRGKRGYKRLLRQLEKDQLPLIEQGGPLA